MNMCRIRWGIGLIVAMLLSSSPARAQGDQTLEPWERGVTTQQMQQARLHFQLALELHQQLLLNEAAAEYRRALSHWEHPKIYFYLSRVWMKLGRAVAAYEALSEALRWGQRGLVENDYQMALQMQRDLLETQIAELDVRCEQAGAEISLDGELLFVGPNRRRVVVSAGKHQIVAKQPEHRTEIRDLAIFPGEQKQVTITLRAVVEHAGSTRRWASWKPWAVVGGGVAVAMMGGAMHRLSAASFTAYDREFTRRCWPGCVLAETPDLTERLHRAHMQQKLAVSSYVIGGVAMATGMLLMSLNAPQPSSRQPRDGNAARMSLMPELLPSGIGVSAIMGF
jgi:hypothetical protein